MSEALSNYFRCLLGHKNSPLSGYFFVERLAFLAGTFAFVVVFRAKRPLAGVALANNSFACSCVMDVGSVSFGILAFFLPSVIYGP